MIISKVPAKEWKTFSKGAMAEMFSVTNSLEWELIDFVLVGRDEKTDGLVGFITCKETAAYALYWEYGGLFPEHQGRGQVVKLIRQAIDWAKERYKLVYFLVKQDNVPMHKLALAVGFLIMGIRHINGTILVEYILEFEEGHNEVATETS